MPTLPRGPTGIPIPLTPSADMRRFFEGVVQRLKRLDGEIRGTAADVSGVRRVVDGMAADTGAGVPTLDTPPKPQGVEVLCGIGICFLDWVNPFRQYVNHARALIFRNTVDEFDTAAEVGQATYAIYVDDDVEDETEYFYWVRFESTGGVLGPVSDAVTGETAIDVEGLHDDILDYVQSSPLAAALDSADVSAPAFVTEEIRRFSGVIVALLSSATDENARVIARLEAAGSGYVLGDEPNMFDGDTLADASAELDTQTAADATWLAGYDDNTERYVVLRYYDD